MPFFLRLILRCSFTLALTPNDYWEHRSNKEFKGHITLPPNQQNLRIQLARQKGNKEVTTVIRDFAGPQEDFAALGRMLKQACGTGGTLKAGEIVLQGDKRQEVTLCLEKKGYKYKLVGG